MYNLYNCNYLLPASMVVLKPPAFIIAIEAYAQDPGLAFFFHLKNI